MGINNITKKSTWSGIRPRTWQLEAYAEVCNHFNTKRPDAVLISAFMGTGKSELIAQIATSIILKPGEIVCISTTTVDIVEDLKAIFRKMGIDVGVVFSRSDTIKPITIICDRSSHKLIDENIKFLINDEAHRSECESYLNFTEEAQPECILGLTATAWRPEPSQVLSLYKKVIYRYDSAAALRDKIIVPWKIANYTKRSRKRITQNESCVEMAKTFEGKGVVNAHSIKDAERFNRLLQINGVESEVLHSGLTYSQQDQIKDDFINGDTRVLVYVNMLKEGVNYPFLRWLILRRKVGSRLRFVQEIGRLLRVDEGKDYCEFYDPHDLFGKFNVSYDDAINVGDINGHDRGFASGGGFDFLYHSYETKMHVENAIRNVSSILKAYGLKMTMDKAATMKVFCDDALHRDFKEMAGGRKPKNWEHLLTEIDKKFLIIKRSYGLEIIKILRKIELLGFWPEIDKNRIIKLSQEQQEKISIVNIMRFKPYFWEGMYYSKIELCTRFDMSKDTFELRKKKGWSLKDTLMKPLRNRQMGGLEGYVGKIYGALTILKVNKIKKLKQNTSFICKCKCGEIFSRAYGTIMNSKKCTCVKTVKRHHRKRVEIMQEADLVGKTIKGYHFTSKEKRTTTPGKFEWVFYGHCIECGKHIKISKYNLKNRDEPCDHKVRKGISNNGIKSYQENSA